MVQRRSLAAKHATDTPRALRGLLPSFDVRAVLDAAGISRRIVHYARGPVVYAQGRPANNLFYIQQGGVKLSVLSQRGREAIVAMLAPGDFFVEGFRKLGFIKYNGTLTVESALLSVVLHN